MPDVWFLFYIPGGIIAAVFFILILVFYRLGFLLRVKRMKMLHAKDDQELGSLNGAMMGLLALLLAFTFGMANSRYDLRRELVVKEANIIGTAILRTDVYPDSIRTELRGMFKEYVEARIGYYKAGTDIEAVNLHFSKGNDLSRNIWKTATSYARTDDITTRTAQLLPALNEMIDIVTSRKASGEAHLPHSILYFLFALCFCVSFMMGYDKRERFDWIVTAGFSLMLSITIYIILDLDRPRRGLINLDKQNEKIVELRELFK